MTVSTMQALVLHGQRDLRLETRQVPTPGPGELLIEVEAVGVCGTDVAEWATGPHLMPIGTQRHDGSTVGPIIPGHEFAGTVHAVGEDVHPAWIGRRIASSGIRVCGQCDACRAGSSGRCPEYSVAGLHRDGALAEYVVTPQDASVRVDDVGLSAAEAVLVQPTAIALHAVRLSGVTAGQTAVVVGIGGIGAFLIHVLHSLGVKVGAIDVDERRQRVGIDLGADTLLDDATADVVFDATGAEAAFPTAFARLRSGGTLVMVGVHKKHIPVELAAVTLRELRIIGSNSMSHPRDFADSAQLVSRRRGGWDDVLSAPVTLDAVESQVLIPLSEGRGTAIKTIVTPRTSKRSPQHGDGSHA